ncbi:MAG TPA: hypothetical protein VHR88_06865 [Solirubrobacteraceae bacterium]|jgi:hypothetical protein|nr:hypothetical protein [Solirubrobacteraceae bacterium]
MAEDPLARLRAQVEAAHEAAQRVAEEIPAAGWAAPGEQARPGYDTPEMRALVALIELVRDLVPADVQQQLVELVRELLMLVRALIDLVVARLERRPPAEAEVEDIPLT